jgi:hypothetical protein
VILFYLALGGGPHRHTKSSCSGGSILRILISIGTRPEAIKLAPVVDALNAVAGVTTRVCLTGQHPDMAQAALHQFGIDADLTLEPEGRLRDPVGPLQPFSARACVPAGA